MMAVDTTYDVNAKPVDWIGALYAADPNLNQAFDAVTVHPYGDVDGYTPGWNRWQFRRIEQIRASLVARGAADKPFYITEIGYSTCPAGGSAGCVSEAAQSADIVKVITAMRTTYSSFVRGAWVYGYLDAGSGAADDREGFYGLVRRDGTPKPGWAAINALIRQG
jgi:exo-beta-1,3-glucanase (GH17 family)